MSPPIALPASTSTSGYEDGFGRRALAFDREDGAILERLHLRPEFSIYERSLRESFSRLPPHADAPVVAPRTLERDGLTGELVAVSPFVTGERLSDLLDAASEHAREEGAVPGIEVALGFLLDVLPTLETLRSTTGLAHGALAPSRCVLTTTGRVVLTECGFAPVLQRLNLSRQRLWREFRVAMPPATGSARFDSTADVSQAAVVSVMLVLGRPMTDDDAVDALPELMAEVIEIAQIRSNVTFAINLQRFLQRALPLPGRRAYETADAALQDVRHLASGIGVALCQTSLAEFVRNTAAPGFAVIAGEDAEDVIRRAPETPRVVALSEAPEPIITIPDPPPVEDVECPPIESILAAADVHVAHFEELEPMALATPADALESSDPPANVPAAPGEMAQTEVQQTPPPSSSVEEPPVQPVRESRATRRRRSRAKRDQSDTLRSTVAAAPVPEPVTAAIATPEPEPPPATAPAPLIEIAPAAAAVSEPAAAPAPVVNMQPIAVVPEPAIPQPVFGPLPIPATAPLWQPSQAAPPPPVAATPRLVPTAAPSHGPVRLKSEPPAGFSPKSTRYEPRDFSAVHLDRRSGTLDGSIRRSWTFVAVAAVLLIAVGVTTARRYLPDTESAEAKGGSAPVTVAAPPPVTTGTIVVQTQPPGARVLLDGSPAGETPLRIVDVAPGRHVLTFVTASATVKRTVKVEADKTVTLDVPVFSGWVAVFAPIVLEISEEGRALGTTEDGRLMLAPGRHTLTLTNRDFGYSASHAVDVEAGEVKSLNIRPAGTVNLNAVPWAEVWIDGKKAGETPLANLELPLGNREVIFRHPEFGERRTMTRVTAGPATAVTVDFSK